ncbi:hypothetical protein LC603019_01050 [Lawsonella clevelandensis]|uniref:Uncharacterized protein n=1 Tax=Lawsonella clevelandensis TaxID=1528099 RepID=A0A5E3ZXU1_9ACTN|nr:hypothetical protein LC603019_01050 [Lawsonella clevelandensis]
MHYGAAAVFYPRLGGRAGVSGAGCAHKPRGVSDGGGVAVAVGAPGFVGGSVFCGFRVFIVAAAVSRCPAGEYGGVLSWFGCSLHCERSGSLGCGSRCPPCCGSLLSRPLRPHYARLLAGGGDGTAAVPRWPAAFLGRGVGEPHPDPGVCAAFAHRWSYPNVEFVRRGRLLPAVAAGGMGVVGAAGAAGAVAHPHYCGGVAVVLGVGVGAAGSAVGAARGA